MKAVLLFLLIGLIAVGCRPGNAGDTPPEAGQNQSSQAKLAENIRSGSVQLQACLDSLAELDAQMKAQAEGAEGEVADGFAEAIDYIDSVGETLTEVPLESPTENEVQKNLVKWDDHRLALITAANDAYLSLRSARTIIEGLAQHKKSLTESLNMTDTLISDLAEAIQSLGGEVETGEEE